MPNKEIQDLIEFIEMEEGPTLDKQTILARLSEFRVTKISRHWQDIVDLFHLLMCKEDHQHGCLYYEERPLDTCWSKPAHKTWLSRTENFFKEYNLSAELEIKAFLIRISKIFEAIESNQDYLKMFVQLIKERYL